MGVRMVPVDQPELFAVDVELDQQVRANELAILDDDLV
jgi:hypothetical protein